MPGLCDSRRVNPESPAMPQTFATTDGLMLVYDDQGSGTPLLCLAGLTRNMADFETVLPLADRLRLIRLDSRGRGASDHDPDPANYTIAHEAADVLALLDHLGLPRVAILGTSRGGLIAMALAVQHRHRLTGVLLNDIGPVIEPEGLAAIRDYIGIRPRHADYDQAATGLQRFHAAGFPGVPLPVWRVFARRIYSQAADGLDLRYDPALRVNVLAAAGPAADLWPLFSALAGLPVAVLRGANSNLLSAATLAEMIRRHPGLIAATVPDRGHVPFLDEPASVALIDAFVAALP